MRKLKPFAWIIIKLLYFIGIILNNATFNPTFNPTINPTFNPTFNGIITPFPTNKPTIKPTIMTDIPTMLPTLIPTFNPSMNPTNTPTVNKNLLFQYFNLSFSGGPAYTNTWKPYVNITGEFCVKITDINDLIVPCKNYGNFDGFGVIEIFDDNNNLIYYPFETSQNTNTNEIYFGFDFEYSCFNFIPNQIRFEIYFKFIKFSDNI